LIDLCIIISLKKVKRCDCEVEEKNERDTTWNTTMKIIGRERKYKLYKIHKVHHKIFHPTVHKFFP
jgi:hypothetical protein